MPADRPDELIVEASVGRHLAFAPVAFAVTEGPANALLYANTLFRQLESAGKIVIGRPSASASAPRSAAADLAPLLERVFRSQETARDVVLDRPDSGAAAWSCTVWPVTESDSSPTKLVIEVRDVELVEGARTRQRAIAEQLLLGALREQDVARDAVAATERAQYLARVSHELSTSLDEDAVRDTVRRLTLPRPGTWCIVDVVESNGALHCLGVVHPDPAKQELTLRLAAQWPVTGAGGGAAPRSEQPHVVAHDAGPALLAAAHGEDNLRLLEQIGFGSLLVAPLIVRACVRGAITFVTREADPLFTADEIALATDLASRCGLALDNARLYREADALRLVAETASRLKSQFLGSMSHELRTPLNAIGGYAELIDIGIHGPVTAEQHVALARVKANQQHLLAMITEILNFVRVESGRMEYRTGAVPMSEAIASVAEMLRGPADEKRLTLETPRGEPAGAVAWADPDRVRQILINLVMNAVKYTPPDGGTITLGCGVVGDRALAFVADTGPGIPADKLDSVFEPFVQLTAGLSNRPDGVGLGLAISRDLARAMGGDLTLQSTVGVGSRFTLTLPLAPSGASPSSGGAP